MRGSRTAAMVAACLLAASSMSNLNAAAQEDQPVRRIATGHVDAFSAVAPDPGSIELMLLDNDGHHNYDDVVLVVSDGAKFVVPEAAGLNDWSFLGTPGSDVWRIGESPLGGAPWVGWDANHSSLRVNLAGSDDLYYRIDSVTGQNGPRPGNLVLWRGRWAGQTIGSPGTEQRARRPMYSTRTGLPAANSAGFPYGHHHFDWTFDAPGVYCVAAAVQALTVDGRPVSDRGQLTFVVGDTIDPATVEPCGRVQPYPTGSHPAAVQAPAGETVIDRGWMALTPELAEGELTVSLRREHDRFLGPPTAHAVDDVVLHASSVVPTEIEGENSTVGPAGATFFHMFGPFAPFGMPLLGWDMTKVTLDEIPQGLRLRLLDVRGPGHVALVKGPGDAGFVADRDPQALLNSTPGYVKTEARFWPGTAEIRDGGEHWWFSEPGVYCVDLEWAGTRADGKAVSTAHTLMFAVAVSAQGLTREECIHEPTEPTVSQLLKVSVDESLGTLAISVEPGDDPHLRLELAPGGQQYQANGALRPVRVIDTRTGDHGWYASGQAGPFTGTSGGMLDGSPLGWTPEVLSQSPGQAVVAGTPVHPTSGDGGLASGATLASAPAGAGRGTARVTASLVLHAPTTTPADRYTSILTITAI